MKKFLYLLLFIPFSVFGQFPTTSTIKAGNEQERRSVEGSPIQSNNVGYNNHVATTQNGNTIDGTVARNTTLAGLTIQPTRTYYVDHVTLANWGPKKVSINVQIANQNQTPSTQNPYADNIILRDSSSVIIPINRYYNEGTSFLIVSGQILSGNFNVTMSIAGDNCPIDQNYGADKVIAFIGTSITNSTGPSYGYQFYHAVVRDTYRKGLGYGGKKVNLRDVNIGNGGFTIANMVELINRKNGVLFVEKPDAIVVEGGMNDASDYAAGGTLRTAVQTNYQLIIDWRNKLYRNVPLILVGSSPRQDALETSGLVPLRAWISGTLIPAQSDPTIGYCDFSSGFNTSLQSNYLETTPGTGIHPTAVPHTSVLAANLLATLASMLITF